MNYSEAIKNIRPGESVRVDIPQGLPLEYKTWSSDGCITQSFVCTKIVVYHWDDDDRWCIDRYYHEDGKDHWTCKHYDLTKESREKVYKFLRENGTK